MAGKKKILLLSGAVLIALLTRLAVYWLDPVLSRDGCMYIRVAEYIFDHGSFDSVLSEFPDITFPPLFISLIVLLMHCGLSAETAAVSINIVSGVAVPFIAAGISWELFHCKKISWGVLILTICHPLLIKLSGEAQRDMLYLLLFGGGIWLICRSFSQKKWSYCACAGSLFALASLMRYESIECIPLLLLICIIILVSHPDLRGKMICWSLAFCLAAVITVAVVVSLTRSSQYLIKHYQEFCVTKIKSVGKSYNGKLQ